jgi:hypothetical protein
VPKEMSIAQIRRDYDGQWVLMVEPKVDQQLRPTRGKVVSHNPDRNVVHQELLRLKPKSFAIVFAGNRTKDSAVVL